MYTIIQAAGWYTYFEPITTSIKELGVEAIIEKLIQL